MTLLALVQRAARGRKGARAWQNQIIDGWDVDAACANAFPAAQVLLEKPWRRKFGEVLELSLQEMRSRVGALMQAVATTSAALLRGGSTRVGARGSTLRMAQVDTGGLGAPDICVLGGGFGGLYTALRLSKLDWGDAPRPRVTLVDQQERFVFLPMLYEVATGAASCWEVTLAHCRAARPLTLSPHAHAGAHAYPNPQPHLHLRPHAHAHPHPPPRPGRTALHRGARGQRRRVRTRHSRRAGR